MNIHKILIHWVKINCEKIFKIHPSLQGRFFDAGEELGLDLCFPVSPISLYCMTPVGFRLPTPYCMTPVGFRLPTPTPTNEFNNLLFLTKAIISYQTRVT